MVYHKSYEHFKFHKVVYRHYSGEVENVYIILQQIYSGSGVRNFIGIARVLYIYKILQNKFGLFFWTHYSSNTYQF